MSCSNLVNHVRLSPNCTKPRNKKIDAIVIHHVAGNATVDAVGALFAEPKRQASANYGVGTDGRVACYVEEENRAYTTSNAGIDNRAITIEVANCGGAPNWPVSDQALEAVIALCVDVCKRHGFKLNYTGDKSGNLHMHKWYASTACPGPYLAGKFPYIAEEVNRRLGAEKPGTGNGEAPMKGFSVKMEYMKPGDKGDNVKALQILLKGNHYDLGDFGPGKDGIDGIYGQKTAAAVQKLKKDRHLKTTNNVADEAVMRCLLGMK